MQSRSFRIWIFAWRTYAVFATCSNWKVHVDCVEGGWEDQSQLGCRHYSPMNEGSNWGITQHTLQESSVGKCLLELSVNASRAI